MPADTAESTDTTSAPSTTSPETAPVVTASTVTPTTEPEPTSPPTTEPTTGELYLRGDGLGNFDFGVPPSELIAAITELLGRPFHDEVTLYTEEDPADPGWYRVPLGLDSFRYPVGRTTCWVGTFCVYFAGAEPQTKFVGWEYWGPTGAFRTVDGLTLGSRWSDFPSMDARPLCYIKGFGSYNDISLELEAWELRSGTHFAWITTTADGGFETHSPDPAKTSVYLMYAGQRPVVLWDDC
ncbi:MAG: hypothetical protein ABL953_07375 [Ilumatobacteraceae bacterium]